MLYTINTVDKNLKLEILGKKKLEFDSFEKNLEF